MQSLLGYSLPTPVVWAVAFAIIFALLAIFALVLRKLAGARLNLQGGAARGRQPRLGVVDAFSLDRQRQLVIVRRDNVEHLVLLGGPNDLLIESQILRGAPGSMLREPELRAEPPRPDLQRSETAPMPPAPQPRADMPPPPQPRVEMPPPSRPAPTSAPADAAKPDARSLAPRYEPPRPPVRPATPPAPAPLAPTSAQPADRYRAPPAPMEPQRPAALAPSTPPAPPSPTQASAAAALVPEKPVLERPARSAPEIVVPPPPPLQAVRETPLAASPDLSKRADDANKRPVAEGPDRRSDIKSPGPAAPLRPVSPNFVPPPPVARPAMATLGDLMASSEPKSQERPPIEPAPPTTRPAEPARPELAKPEPTRPEPAKPEPGKPEPRVIRPEPDLTGVFAQDEKPAGPQQATKRVEPILPKPVSPTPAKNGTDAMDFDSLEAEMSRLLGRDPAVRKD